MKVSTNAIPCILCNRMLEQRSDKNGKPYFVCDECGTQFFIRGINGKERLKQFQNDAGVQPVAKSAQTLRKDVQTLQGYIETFCEDEQIIVEPSGGVRDAVPFTEWSRQVCDRIKDAISHGRTK